MAKTNNILPVHAAVGDDELKRSETARRLRVRLEEEGDLSFDLSEFDGETATGADIVSACLTIPFLAPRRLVMVKHADKLRKADMDAIVEYAKDPVDSCVLFLSAVKLAKSSRLYKAVAALGETAIIDCALPKGFQLQKKVVAMAAAKGMNLTDSGASYLIECVGQDTIFLNGELDKLALACSGARRITEKEVAQFVEATVEVKPWKFLEPFSARDVVGSLAWLDSARGVSVYSLSPLVAQRIRELICAKTLQAQGRPGDLIKELGLSPSDAWKVKNHTRYARMFTEDELIGALSTLRETEKSMKSSSHAEEDFRMWVLQTLAKRS